MHIVFYHKNCNDGTLAAFSLWEKNPTKTLCIPITYHEFRDQTPEEFFEDCFERKFNAAVFNSSFGKSGFGDYNSIMKHAKTEFNAYLVDISVPKHILEAICDTFKRVVVLDHHESANEIYKNDPEFVVCRESEEEVLYRFKDNCSVYMNHKHSGAYMTWMYANPEEKIPPYYIQLTSMCDTWNKTDENADFFAAGFRFMNAETFEQVKEVVSDTSSYQR